MAPDYNLDIDNWRRDMERQNCWEYKDCGREPGGKEEKTLGVCPACMAGEGDGENSGKKRGRICWAVTGTFCGGKIQGTFAQKEVTCLDCGFFNKVEEEEGESFKLLLSGQAPEKEKQQK